MKDGLIDLLSKSLNRTPKYSYIHGIVEFSPNRGAYFVKPYWYRVGARMRLHFKTINTMRFPPMQLKCCGIISADDWEPITGPIYLPPSCCQKPVIDTTSCTKENASKVGCEKILLESLHDTIDTITLVVMIICLIQVSK